VEPSAPVKLFRQPYILGEAGELCKFVGESQRDGAGGPAVSLGKTRWHEGEIGRGLRDPPLMDWGK
jgi:hypothetical protein